MPESPTSPPTSPLPGSPTNNATPPSPVSALLRATVLFAAFLALQLVLFKSLLTFPSSRFLPAPRRSNSTWANGAVDDAEECKAGLIYVYDLPPEFNHDLVAHCDRLWPWYSFCPYLSNGGLGRPAAEVPALSAVVPNASLPNWYNTDQFPLEVIVHRRLLSHRCRTIDASLATAFYVPFYAGLDVGSHLWGPNSTVADRDRAGARLLRWLRGQPFFAKSGGWDHFITLGRITWDFRRYGADGWGTNLVLMPGMENVTRLVIEGDRLDPLDVGVPYPTGFHPRRAADVRAWQEHVLSLDRRNLFGFAGAPRSGFPDDFRDVLLEECEDAGSDRCRAVDCRGTRCNDDGAAVMRLFMGSRFCLQPRGDSFTRRSLFDCMVAGAVPVLFWRRTAYDAYRWFLPRGEEGEWSVFIDRRALRVGNVSVRDVLEGYSERRVRRMRERVVEMIPRLVYGSSPDGLGDGMDDALDVALGGVLKRFRHRRWSIGHEAERPPGRLVAGAPPRRGSSKTTTPPTSNGRNGSVIGQRASRHRSTAASSAYIKTVLSEAPASRSKSLQLS
ncbi:xyloglucan galactosyltransferase XLT2-like isoform X1 [Oryza glaberrima]|uniref:Exostosin GT47 domain-containing protein n=1 Tax=Oryza glaberrima TaxID=4538 RepID=I1Q270_ORYGL|nr:xyloglucan galactosyltransferase XLT2-like isoform X1 [Oryza glaberrima]